LEHVTDAQDGDVELAVLVYISERAEDPQGVLTRRSASVVVRLKILYELRNVRRDPACDLYGGLTPLL
jgi:hypothetical protein